MAGAKWVWAAACPTFFGSDTSDLMEESLDNGTKICLWQNRAESRSAEEGL